MVSAWIYNEADPADQRAPHQTSPPQFVSMSQLAALGVSYWHIPTTVDQARADPEGGRLGEIRRARGYKNHDFIAITPSMANYEDKMRMFFSEHLHEDEEIRYCLAGSGYFDVRRDQDEAWVRILVESGDMIVLPAGMYHRYTNDSNDSITVMRLFQDNPKWEAINRGEQADRTPARAQYREYGAKLASPSFGLSVKRVSGINGESTIISSNAAALANYPHMRAYGGLLYVSGISSRRFDNTHEGVEYHTDGNVTLDIEAQTRAVLTNINTILSAAGADLGHVLDCTCFLVDMADYAKFNSVYNQFFPAGAHGPSRTTVAVKQLPHPNLLIEIKCVAVDPRAI